MPDLKEMLQQDGYLDAVKLIETLENSVSRKAEFMYLRAYAEQSSFDEEVCRDQLRMLWTAYCLHHNLDVDTVYTMSCWWTRRATTTTCWSCGTG